MYEDHFETTYVSTAGDETFYNFNKAVYDFCEDEAAE